MEGTITEQKLRGGYYTPKAISEFMARWAIQTNNAKVLEPSCGDGSILTSAVDSLLEYGADPQNISSCLLGIELNSEEAEKAYKRLKDKGITNISDSIVVSDFFRYCSEHLMDRVNFDAVIGNPPFIRYQNFSEEYRNVAFDLMKQKGFQPTRLTNSWLPFLVICSYLLTLNGKLAMVVPAELFQVNYTKETRQFLSEYYDRITIITFKKLVFEGIQQEVVLLLCERHVEEDTGVRTIELEDIDDLNRLDPINLPQLEIKPIDHNSEKWTQYFLSRDEIVLLRSLRDNPRLKVTKNVIDVDVGVVTGQNQYFVLTNEKVEEYALQDAVSRIVTRSAHLQGALFREADWVENGINGAGVHLFIPSNLPFEKLPSAVQNYIQQGEQEGVNTGYKCRIRKNWYVVPSLWIPDAFMLRQVHSYPKLILNQANATCTDTIHRVRFVGDINGKLIVAAFLNSLTFAFSEVTGRSYGGGVMTFEPSEAEKLPIPLVGAENLDLELIDTLLRENNIEEILNLTDQVLLIEGLGLDPREVTMLRSIWHKLRDRRINRK